MLKIVLVLQVLILALFGFLLFYVQNTIGDLSTQVSSAMVVIEDMKNVLRSDCVRVIGVYNNMCIYYKSLTITLGSRLDQFRITVGSLQDQFEVTLESL